MARLTETVAKDLLTAHGIARPTGVVVTDGRHGDGTDVASRLAHLSGPLYVKAQVPIGDRAAVGAVVRVDDVAAAVTAVERMLGATFRGVLAKSVLVEQETAGDWLGYASVRVPDDRRGRIVIVERDGGGGFDPSNAPVLLEFGANVEQHEVRTALAARGHAGAELVHLTAFVHRLCTSAHDWSTYVLEVNPFVVTAGGVVALDAKAEVDDYSLGLLPGSVSIESEELTPRERRALDTQLTDHQGTLRYVQLIDETTSPERTFVGSHAVGGGESMIIMDALADIGLDPVNYCDTSGSPSRAKVATATELIATQPHISGYFFSSCIANQPLSVTANGLVDGFHAAGWNAPTVLRIAGNEEAEAIQILEAWGASVSAPVRVFGRETDEWTAARCLAEMLEERS